MKYLITGLGNPGEKYVLTRHNIGFLVAEFLAEDLNTTFSTDRYADVASARFRGKECIIIKPNTYMNLSGKAVRYWLQQEKIPIENLLVILDDIALPFGKVRMRKKGGDGGHNGLKSIQELMNTADYCRLRFGVGNDFPRGRQAEYVLSNWTNEQSEMLPERLKIAKDMIQSFMATGPDRTMSLFNNN